MARRAAWSEERLTIAGTWLSAALLVVTAASQCQTGERANALSQVPAPLVMAGCVLPAVAFVLVHAAVVQGRRGWAVQSLVAFLVVTSLAWMAIWGAWMLVPMAVAATVFTARPPVNVLASAVVLLAFAVTLVEAGDNASDPFVAVGVPLATLVISYVLYIMTRLVLVLRELRVTRERLARQRVDEERTRISRQLHDILGRTLVTASLRNETAQLLLDSDVTGARHQLEELRATVMEGQSQLRSLTSGPAIIGLEHELAAAQETFEQLGVRCVVATEPVAERGVDRLLAAVLREAVTNMLKHSRPGRCGIRLEREDAGVSFVVDNDGAPLEPLPDTGGTGLAFLGEQVARAGGTLGAGSAPGGRYEVVVRLPLRGGAESEERP